MEKMKNFFRTGDRVERVGTSAREIDLLVSELGRLYKERLQALRLGTHMDLHVITTRIVAVKSRLNEL